MEKMLWRATCAGVVLGIPIAGLWPFHVPPNDVSWLSHGNGLYFGKLGTIASADLFKARGSRQGSCTMEIVLAPSRLDSDGMIVAFFRPQQRVTPFAMRQFREGLVLELETDVQSALKVERYVGNVFREERQILLTITSGRGRTSAYVDGALIETLSDFDISGRDLTGQLLIGGAPLSSYTWSGQVEGLAIHDRELSAAEVSTSFSQWLEGNGHDSASNDSVVARYAFREGTGEVVHDQVNIAPDLLIPKRFFVLDRTFLEPPWTAFRSG